MKKFLGLFFALCLLFLLPQICLGEELIVAAPGESGYDVERVLAMAKGMGFIKSMDAGEENYKEKYVDGVKAMEAAFSLTPDGIIHVSEIQALEKLLYPGSKGDAMKYMLEKLYDLGFITEKLPAIHETYSAAYKTAVKKAEKKYGLTEDGILTESEQKAIKGKYVAPPAKPTNLNMTASGTTLTITWNRVSGALYYDVYVNDTLVGTTSSTSFTHKNAQKGEFLYATVIAHKYTAASGHSDGASLILYASPSISELLGNREAWAWKYVKISNTQMVRKIYEGSDIYILVKKTENGKTHPLYLKIGSYKDWTYDSGGQLQFSEVQGTIRGEGYFLPDTHYSTTYGQIPVIELTHINWEY